VLNVDGGVICTLSDGQSFGEVALYGNLMRRTATVVSPSYCDLDILLKDHFDSLMASFPDAKVTVFCFNSLCSTFSLPNISIGALHQTGG
jgi:hypothetical protein